MVYLTVRRSSKVFVKGARDGAQISDHHSWTPSKDIKGDGFFPTSTPPAYPLTPVRFRHNSEKSKELFAADGNFSYGVTPTKAHFSTGKAASRFVTTMGGSVTGTPTAHQHIAVTVGGSTSSTPRRDGDTVRDQFVPSRADAYRMHSPREGGEASSSSGSLSRSSVWSSWGVTRVPQATAAEDVDQRGRSQQGSYTGWARMLGFGLPETPPDAEAGVSPPSGEDSEPLEPPAAPPPIRTRRAL